MCSVCYLLHANCTSLATFLVLPPPYVILLIRGPQRDTVDSPIQFLLLVKIDCVSFSRHVDVWLTTREAFLVEKIAFEHFFSLLISKTP